MPSLHATNDENPQTNDFEVRKKMKNYWDIYKPSLESMMLNHDAKYLAENEQNELLSYLPSYKGKKVLELGAGIGRFTSRFACMADQVTAVDFMGPYIEENKKMNHQFKNVTYHCADVTKLEFEENSFDLIFSNWLFMYLSNAEMAKVFFKILRWLSPGGHFFIRESCYHQSGNVPRPENPTKYRTPYEYFKAFSDCTFEKAHFNILFARNVVTYIQHYGNPNQVCMLVQKTNEQRKVGAAGAARFLQHLYEPNTSLHHHQLLGPIFQQGSSHSLEALGDRLRLRSGKRVLHIGNDVGEIALNFAENFGCFVHCMCLSLERIHTAIERQGKLPINLRKKILYEYCGEFPEKIELPSEAYDAILCTDILHDTSSMQVLLRILKESLRSEGKICLMDYFANNLRKKTGYATTLSSSVSDEEMEDLITKNGFRLDGVEGDNLCAISLLKNRKSSALSELEEDEVKPFLEELESRILSLESGNIKWTKFFASLIE